MKLISWNVNGINACMNKGLCDFVTKEAAEMYCFQEVKATKEKLPRLVPGYFEFHNHAQKKGYSGVSILSKVKPRSLSEGIGHAQFDNEGRVITLEFDKFFLVNAYFPHAHRELTRIGFKLDFNNRFSQFCKKLSLRKPIIIASDFNVAHTALDLKNPKSNEKNAGFTKEERAWFDSFLKEGFVDSFREFTKDGDHYTWWSYRNNARERNIGWRIDYFVVSAALRPELIESTILKDVLGSDHCPILLQLKNSL